ncbi:hypothetical protein [Kocuria tytonis]|uniref:Uncharacterized protein n=1 Tax=Kocuria tytonis TaxID=2054280 RepID=A0A495A869_9MICC|nr:hypothetical protein [Kocuria tytonis]RKQ36221.1 hypothetical protein C1C97_000600 [Kocuria tytonis]
MTRPKYRVHVWKDRWKFGDQEWLMGVWADGEPVVFRPNAPIGFPTHAEALAAGLAWANELNAREQEEA